LKSIKELHDRDFNLWVEETKKAIQNRDFENMDWDNLLDEIDDMGKSEKRSRFELFRTLDCSYLKITILVSRKRMWRLFGKSILTKNAPP
jgi:hypothetical protein